MTEKKELCKIPQFIEFQFYPQQQMHSFIEIENLADEIVSFKIKTNTPTQYLVKPMQGQIYNKQKIKIVFKRKKLSQEAFDSIQKGQKTIKQKFLFNITCRSKNAIGIQKVDQMTYFMNVKFGHPRKPVTQTSPVKKVKKSRPNEQKRQQLEEFSNLVKIQKNNLNSLKQLRNSLQGELEELLIIKQQSSAASGERQSPKQINMQNVIFLIVFALLVGLWL